MRFSQMVNVPNEIIEKYVKWTNRKSIFEQQIVLLAKVYVYLSQMGQEWLDLCS